MASKAMWEVDPETRSKLAALQKESSNNVCCDCNAPSPQWASPKFGIFICLTCAGKHRGLGVHISFVRSVSMDAFKAIEIERMRLGGNAGWRKFYEEHESTDKSSITWDDGTDSDRYTSEVGEEWKERLTAKVEGREYVPSDKKTAPAPVKKQTSFATSGSRSGTPLSGSASRSESPSQQQQPGGKVKVDDEYFARLGNANATRPDHVPPSQGGKYAGFGNTPGPASGAQNAPSFEDMQKDTVAAITKGFGWFTSTVTKTAKNVNDGYLQPASKQFSQTDFARQAQTTAAILAKQAQAAGKNASEGFNRFVEGDEQGGHARASNMDETRKSFWDDFSNLADQRKEAGSAGSSAIGTSAMGKGRAGGSAAPPAKKKTDEWDDW